MAGCQRPEPCRNPINAVEVEMCSSRITCFIFVILCCLFLPAQIWPQQKKASPQGTSIPEISLKQAVMCEGIEGFKPINEAVVFSATLEAVACYTLFDPVPAQTQIYHNWYYRDNLTTRKRLSLKPPRWGTFSSIKPREVDKGPWRVDIIDDKGHVFQTLRFSIAD